MRDLIGRISKGRPLSFLFLISSLFLANNQLTAISPKDSIDYRKNRKSVWKYLDQIYLENDNLFNIIDSFHYYNNALLLYKGKEPLKPQIDNIINQSVFHEKLKEEEIARQLLQKGLELAIKENYINGEIKVLRAYGIFLDHLGKIENSMDTFQLAQDLSIEHQLPRWEAIIGSNIIYGLSNYHSKDSSVTPRIRKQRLRNIEIFTELKDSILLLRNQNQLFILDEKYDKALETVKTLEATGRWHKDAFYPLKAKVFLLQGDTLAAIQIYEELIHKAIKDKKFSTRYYIASRRLVSVEKARKNYKKAIHWAEIQYKNAKENKVLFDITDAANQLGELYYEVGDYKNAFLFSKEKEEKQKEALGDLSAAQLKYQKYRRAMEREKSSKNLLLKNLEISNRKRQVYLFAAFFAVLFSLILLKYLAVNKKLTKEQAEKNVLLEENNQYIREKNNQINQLNQRLSAKSAKLEESYLQNMLFLTNKNELIKKLNLLAKEEVNDIGDLKKGLSQLLRQEQKENDWKEMEYQLEIANQEFTANLYRKHPNLSPLEMRLCIFLKLNMTTKEIAALTLRKPDSVKVARSRLKKKLQLDNTQKLNVYLNNI